MQVNATNQTVTQSYDDILAGYSECWNVNFNTNIADWSMANVKLHHAYAITGQLDLNRSKYLLAPLASLNDPSVREVNCRAGVQTAKSLIAECLMLYLIANESGNMLWLQSSDEMARRFSESRLLPLIQNCDATRKLLGGQKYTTKLLGVKLPSFNLSISGAKTNALQSLSIRYLVADEVWLYEAGFLTQAKARLTAFPHTSKLLCVSQAGEHNDDWSTQFNSGTIYTWGWRCPHCQHHQPLVFNTRNGETYSGIVWDRNEITYKDNVWNYELAGESARLRCAKCQQDTHDTPTNRRLLNDTGDYVQTQSGPSSVVSYQWNHLASIDISYRSVVIKYLQAHDSYSDYGYTIPLQEFYQKVLGLPWRVREAAKPIDLRTGDYAEGSVWEQAKLRLMSIDCQNNFQKFYYVVRDWAENGDSRLVTIGTADNWEQLREVQSNHRIKDQCVLVDSGYEGFEVYRKCVEYGHTNGKHFRSWIALKGSPNEYFHHSDPNSSNRDIRPYSKPNWVNPYEGTSTKNPKRCPLYLWSNPSIKDMLYRLRTGKGSAWLVPVDASFDLDTYNKHLNSETKQPVHDRKSGKVSYRYIQNDSENHYFDCECMQLAGAIIACVYNPTKNIVSPQLPKTVE